MNIKEYLNQARYLDARINSKIEQQEKLHEIINKATATMSDMPGTPNRNISTREKAIAKMVDLEKEIDAEIDRLVDLKKEIRDVIRNVPNESYRALLEFRYVSFATWEEIAGDMCISRRSAYRMHNEALTEAEKVKGELFDL